MKVKIKTITPIHIGTGKKLGELEFFNNTRINYDKLFELITEKNQVEFFEWIDQNPKITVSEIRNKFKISSEEIKKCGLYSFSSSFKNDLNEGIKDSSYNLFIPGSSLKGSLRTALMFKFLSLNSKKNLLSNYIDELNSESKRCKDDRKKIDKFKKKADDRLNNEVFICGVEKENKDKIEIIFDDQKYDLLKLVKVSDSSSVSTHDNGEITELQVYALKKSAAHKRKFKTYTESISENVELEFDISFDIEFLKQAKIELQNQNSLFGKKYFIGIKDKLKDLFDIDLEKENEFSEQKIVNSLVNSWVQYGNAVSNLEKEWVNSVKNVGNINISLLNKLYEQKDKVKVGFGTGFSGMTLLPLLLKDEKLINKVFDIYKNIKIGQHNSSTTPLNIDEFPFTRKYINKQNIFSGFGWIKFVRNYEVVDTAEKEDYIEKTKPKPPNSVIAEVIDVQKKPPIIRILEGEFAGKETILPSVTLENLDITLNSKVYVELIFQKKVLQKAVYKGKVN